MFSPVYILVRDNIGIISVVKIERLSRKKNCARAFRTKSQKRNNIFVNLFKLWAILWLTLRAVDVIKILYRSDRYEIKCQQ